MKAELQLAQKVEDYLNTYGSKLAARQKCQTCVHNTPTMN
jgi:hypothetical protein